ncbi:xanthine dehydrogenase family protein molybdopterin-binding subunit [Chondrinema litorale]|uniref:xanthine dehydrogenase family protein molybdopterin-binding subunit n=1 Tax=Chondrinema litorale TaxID=2994555 RepID=UPI002542FF9C|nr:molybdopterin cofactor-binding domain-containing protein [Chondrinema litorale]UZR98102.1 molybdopterin-dependent oxidoreductase [Chondrinema litorale]
MQNLKTSRRTFIKSAGFLSIGFTMFGSSCIQRSDAPISSNAVDDSRVNAWLQVLENGKVKILTGKMELGQGVKTAIMQVAAEELNTDMSLIEIHVAETDITPNEGYTAGSRSIETSAMSVRNAAACTREKLIELASKELEVDQNALTLKDATISGGHKQISLYELLKGKQLTEKVGEPKTIFAKTERKVVGKPISRKDIADIVQAKLHFIHDLRFDGMVHARIIRPITYTSKLVSVDENLLNKEEGFKKLVKVGSFLGVIAEEEFQTIKLAKTIKKNAQWENPETLPANTPLKELIQSLPADTETDKASGDWETSIQQTKIQHKASYFKPYIMHAANGPSCAIALFKEGKLNIWTHSQGVYPLRSTLSSLLELAEDKIHIQGVPGSGCYGHNAADDVAAEAAILAKNYPDKHIRLQWMREEENSWEPYGTAMLMELEAGLDENGKIQGWKYDLWSDGHSTRPGRNAENLLPARYMDKGYKRPASGFRGGATRNAEPYYEIANMQLQSHIFTGPLRRSALRGLGAYANIFAIESFIDELAEKANIEPIDFRTMHLKDARALYCLQKLKTNIRNVKSAENEGLGFAFSRYKNSASYCGVAAHVFVDRKKGAVKVKKMWAVIDSGETINPDGLKNQTEGGMIQSASWALKEAVTFDENHITSIDWASYPIFRYNDAPETEVEVIDRVDQPPLGAGEAAQGPATAAIVNAIHKATGIRIRELPLNQELLKKP